MYVFINDRKASNETGSQTIEMGT